MSHDIGGNQMAVRKRTWTKPNGEIGKSWVADYKSNGKRHIKTFPTRKQAVAFRNKTGVEISEGRHVADSVSITVAEAAEIWIKAVELGRGDNPPAENQPSDRIARISSITFFRQSAS